jgi:hypothetical protein
MGDAMKNLMILPTANLEWGFWGTSERNGYDAPMAWDAASRALAEAFKLSPEQTRDLLDARFGRHLADDLSFIKGGPTTAQAIIDHINCRVADREWHSTFARAVREIKSA